MNRLPIVGTLIASTAPLLAQAQHPDAAKLKAEAQKVVSIIKGDKAKTEVYCQMGELGEQIGDAADNKDNKKAEELSRQVTELEKKLGPEYSTLVNDLNNVNPNSPESQEAGSILAQLDAACPD